MSENIEFISAADLPTTEAEEVDVLCVENGELKRKAGATLGGGGGSFVMKLSAEDLGEDGMVMANYDELAKALEAGSHAVIVLPAGVIADEQPAMCMSVITWAYAEGMGLVCYCMTSSEPMPMLFANGSYIPTI